MPFSEVEKKGDICCKIVEAISMGNIICTCELYSKFYRLSAVHTEGNKRGTLHASSCMHALSEIRNPFGTSSLPSFAVFAISMSRNAPGGNMHVSLSLFPLIPLTLCWIKFLITSLTAMGDHDERKGKHERTKDATRGGSDKGSDRQHDLALRIFFVARCSFFLLVLPEAQLS